MSWWEIDGCVIGDTPADALGAAVKAIVPFDLARVLGAAGTALRADAVALVADPRVAAGTLTAFFTDGSAAAAPESSMIFAEAMRDVTQSYVDYLERKPLVAEVLAVLAFVVRGWDTDPEAGAPLVSHIAFVGEVPED